MFKVHVYVYITHTRRTAIHTIDNNAPLETKSLKCITSVPRDRSASFKFTFGSDVARPRPSLFIPVSFFPILYLPSSSHPVQLATDQTYLYLSKMRRYVEHGRDEGRII